MAASRAAISATIAGVARSGGAEALAARISVCTPAAVPAMMHPSHQMYARTRRTASAACSGRRQ
jgi:hypothetical protein